MEKKQICNPAQERLDFNHQDLGKMTIKEINRNPGQKKLFFLPSNN
jgi:hypothetical protein